MTTNHNTNHNADSITRSTLDAAVDRASVRLAVAAQPLTQQQRHLLGWLLDVLEARLAARDGGGAVTVLQAVSYHCGAQVGASMLDYCLAAGLRNAFTGGAR